MKTVIFLKISKKFQDLLENFHPRSNYLFELYKHFFLLFLLQVNSSKAFFQSLWLVEILDFITTTVVTVDLSGVLLFSFQLRS